MYQIVELFRNDSHQFGIAKIHQILNGGNCQMPASFSQQTHVIPLALIGVIFAKIEDPGLFSWEKAGSVRYFREETISIFSRCSFQVSGWLTTIIFFMQLLKCLTKCIANFATINSRNGLSILISKFRAKFNLSIYEVTNYRLFPTLQSEFFLLNPIRNYSKKPGRFIKR